MFDIDAILKERGRYAHFSSLSDILQSMYLSLHCKECISNKELAYFVERLVTERYPECKENDIIKYMREYISGLKDFQSLGIDILYMLFRNTFGGTRLKGYSIPISFIDKTDKGIVIIAKNMY